ncbi:MAG: glycosyltransferase [Deltaproteobacteria bacterium]|nr:glycosyltransferase [Deltaproteobacteria bacterium]
MLEGISDKDLTGPLQEPPAQGPKTESEGCSDELPLVSIVVRSMGRLTLDEALESLALQAYPNIEVVVVNARGGEHRALGDRCGRFQLRLVNQDGPPLPRSKAANLGLSECKGHYLGLLDDDDEITPDHIKGLVDALQNEADEIVGYSAARSSSRTDADCDHIKNFSDPNVTFSKLVLGNVLPIHSVLFPSSLLKRGICFDENFDCYEDWDFWLQMARVAPLKFVNQVTAIYYVGGGSGVSPMQPNEQTVLEARNAVFAKWVRLLTPEEMRAIADSYHQTLYDMLSRCHYLESELQENRLQLEDALRKVDLYDRTSHNMLTQCSYLESELQKNRLQLEDALRKIEEDKIQRMTAERMHDAAVAQLQWHIDSLYSSRSWRLTRPIRWCVKVARDARLLLHRTLKAVYSRLPLTLNQRSAIRSHYFRSRAVSRSAGERTAPVSITVSPYTKRAMETAPIRILMIERWVPRPNQDAGSTMIYNFMRILRRMGHALSFAPFDLVYDPEYTPDIMKLGIECLHAPDVRSIADHLVAAGSTYDVIIACRPDHTEALLPLFKAYCPQARLLYETIDLHFMREARQAEVERNSELLRLSKWRKAQELRIAAAADCTIVVSEQERQVLCQENPDLYVEVIPVIGEIYGCQASYDQRADLVFIGGYEHRPNVDAVIYFVEEILPLIVGCLPKIRFLLVGSHPPKEILDLACKHVIIQGFVPDITELMNRVRVSVNPLRFGAGVKGKMITSMSYGVPCVGTSVAVEGMEVVPGVQALVADDPRAFADEVIRLYTDRQLWEKVSAEGLAFVSKRFSMDVAEEAFKRIFDSLRLEGSRGLQLIRAVSHDTYLRHRSEQELERRHAIEQAYVRNTGQVCTKGFCFVCNREVTFSTDLSFSFTFPDGSVVPNWRERIVCPYCRLNNRMRAAIHLFHLLCHPTPEIRLYLTEQTTQLFRWYENAYKNVTGSEFLGNSIPLGETNKDGILNENLTALTFADDCFDAILSFDVLEHIPNYQRALRECRRCLRAGGSLFFSVPFDLGAQHHLVRAEIDAEGEVRHLLPPEYHGDPINSDGCLCYYHFGWDLLDELRDLGFRDASAYLYWSDRFGYLGGEQLVFRAVK